MSVLGHLQPASVMRYFEEICAIPHGSGNTKAISDYCVDFAKARDLEYRQDSVNNVIIIKPASVGYESAPAVILQGHIDMVCEKEANCPIDMEKDGLCLATDDEWIWAEGTTLGGDDGIAVAMALAALDDREMQHPRLEVVLTVDEEVGMEGAVALETYLLQGRLMLNVDSEEEGITLHETLADESQLIEAIVEDAVLLEELLQALEELDPEGKKMCRLIMEGCSERQAADVMNMARSTFKRHWDRVKEILAERLKDYK